MKANEFDTYFDNDGSIVPFVDITKKERPNRHIKRVNVDFPVWMLNALDEEAKHLGVTRQALVKVWLADCLNKKVILQNQ